MGSGLTPHSEVVVHDAGMDAVLVEHDGVPVLMLRPDMSFQAAVQAVRGVAPHLSADEAARIVRRALPNAVDLGELLSSPDGGCSCSGKEQSASATVPPLGRLGRRWCRRAVVAPTVVGLVLVLGGFAAKTHEAAQERDSLAAQLASVHENLKTIQQTQVKNRRTLTGLASAGAHHDRPDASVPVSAKTQKARKHRSAGRAAKREAKRAGTLTAKTQTANEVPGETVVVVPPGAPRVEVDHTTASDQVKPAKPVKPVKPVLPVAAAPTQHVEEVVKGAGEVLDGTVAAPPDTAADVAEDAAGAVGDVAKGATELLPAK